jgi:NAD(P)-dependent dehydrogenase (short-subunit alcohol dehydrogenase family)
MVRASAEALSARVIDAYGLTEAVGLTHFPPDDAPVCPGSIGKPLPGVDCRLVEPGSGRRARPGAGGELQIRAAHIGVGDWVGTGDLAECDADGNYVITCRLEETFRCKGGQVASARLEAVLQSHPAVTDAAVVGRPDPEEGCLSAAYVVSDWRVRRAELLDHVNVRVAPHQRLTDIEFIASLPRTPTGALLRSKLHKRSSVPCVLITGGSRGLGRALALALARRGTRVALTARNAERLQRTAEDLRCAGGDVLALPADVSKPGNIKKLIGTVESDFGPVGTLVNNAGIQGPIGELWSVDGNDWWHTFEINVLGAALGCAEVLRVMTQRGTGKIINIASHAGVGRWPHLSAYSASKAALIKLTENIAVEARSYGVSVVSFHPGILEIGLGETQLATVASPGSWSEKVSAWIQKCKEEGALTSTESALSALMWLLDNDISALTGSYLTTETVPGGFV